MHHRPVGPPLSARIAGALARPKFLLGPVLAIRGGRVALAGVVTTVVTGVVLAVPVVSGGSIGTSPVALDSSSTASLTSGGGSDVGSDVVDRTTAVTSSAGPVGSGSPSDPAAAPGTTGAATSDHDAPASPPAVPARESPSGAASPSAERSTAPAAAPSSASPEPGAPAPVDPTPTLEPAGVAAKDELRTLLDEARTGCAPLLGDDSLAAVAQAHSAAMRDQDFFGLQDPAGHSPLDAGARAAWIAQGTPAPADVLGAWLADPEVRATILDCGFSSVGIGRARGDGGPWWTLLLA